MSEKREEFTKAIVCPWCKEEQSECYEYDDSGETECGSCSLPFSYQLNEHVKQALTKQEPRDGE